MRALLEGFMSISAATNQLTNATHFKHDMKNLIDIWTIYVKISQTAVEICIIVNLSLENREKNSCKKIFSAEAIAQRYMIHH